MTLEDIFSPVRGDLERVESALADMCRTKDCGVSEVIAHILSAGGKRLRPALVLFAARGCAYSGERSIGMAVAMELVHTASLIHDDVIDGAAVRRGVPTVNSAWGNKGSVLLGDYLYTRVIETLAEDGDLEILRTVAKATACMARGEMIQTLCRDDQEVTEGRYLQVISDKTAALISCACQVGAMLGEGHNGEVEALGSYGQNLGMAFQITDDLLDLTGEEDVTGKAPGNDIREGRMTLPLIHAMGAADRRDGALIRDVFRSGDVDGATLRRIREIVSRYQGIEYSRRKAREYTEAGKRGLEKLEDSESRESLLMLADYVVGRAS
jgi:octaprenyl-diphosphate synthase